MSERVVLITGGSRGIGAALIERFHEGGALVAACARTPIESPHVDQALACDVSDAAQVRASVDAVLARFGRLDVIVNNAGLAGARRRRSP